MTQILLPSNKVKPHPKIPKLNMMFYQSNVILALFLALSPVKASTEWKTCQVESRESLWGRDRSPFYASCDASHMDSPVRHLSEKSPSWGQRASALPAGQTVVALFDGHKQDSQVPRPQALWAETLACQYAHQVVQIEHVSDGKTRNGLTRIDFDNQATLWVISFDTTDSLREMDPQQAAEQVPEWLQLHLNLDDQAPKPWIVAAVPDCYVPYHDNSKCHTYQALLNQFEASRTLIVAQESELDDSADDVQAWAAQGRDVVPLHTASEPAVWLRRGQDNSSATVCAATRLDVATWDIAEKLFS